MSNDDFSSYFFAQYDPSNQGSSNNLPWNNQALLNCPENQPNGYYNSSAPQFNNHNEFNQGFQSSDSENFFNQSQGYGTSDYSNFDFDSNSPQNNYPSDNNYENSWPQNSQTMPAGSENYLPENFGHGNTVPAYNGNSNFSSLVEKEFDEEVTNNTYFDANNGRAAIRTGSKSLNLANHASDKAVSNSNGVKNYITITSKTFAKFMLDQANQEIQKIIYESIQEQQPNDFNAVKNAVMNIITEKIHGKKIHRNGSKQYKITAKKDIEPVFFPQKKDSEDELILKTILRNMMARFIRSKTFEQWVNTEYEAKSSGGKEFYLDVKNLVQFVGVYTDSEFKPRFN